MPSTNGHGTARGVARIYAALARGGAIENVRILDSETLRSAITEHSAGPDRVAGRPSRFGLGFQLTQPERALGPHLDSFGHFGDEAGISGTQDRRGDRHRPPACGPLHSRNDPENRTAPALESAGASSGHPIDYAAESLASGVLPKLVLGSLKMSAGSQMDTPKSRTENFVGFSRSAVAGGILRVRGRA